MPSVRIDNRGEMAIVECAGRFVRNDAAFKLRDAVTSQTSARVVILDLTDTHAIGGGGLGTLLHSCKDGLRTATFDSSYSIPPGLCSTS
jgi:anti-anti-sigma regulatory factor